MGTGPGPRGRTVAPQGRGTGLSVPQAPTTMQHPSPGAGVDGGQTFNGRVGGWGAVA